MDTNRIESTLNRKCGERFMGVYPCDRLPATLPSTRPILIVGNTDRHDRPGKHWIAMKIDDKRGEYFDSFAQPPPTVFKNFMNKHCDSWIQNDHQLQSITSAYCGHYTIFYCLYSSVGHDMIDIVNWFSRRDTGLNDWFVHKFVCKLI